MIKPPNFGVTNRREQVAIMRAKLLRALQVHCFEHVSPEGTIHHLIRPTKNMVYNLLPRLKPLRNTLASGFTPFEK